jgi:hypothetical protein
MLCLGSHVVALAEGVGNLSTRLGIWLGDPDLKMLPAVYVAYYMMSR